MKYDYDIICIGLGPAGMAVSAMGAEMGLKICAIEKNKIGGECMNIGCIPSKSILRIASNYNIFKSFIKFPEEDLTNPMFDNLFEKINNYITYINEKKTMVMFDKVDLLLNKGPASFINKHTVDVDGKKITAKRIFIASGTEPSIPPIPGINDIDILTNANIFNLDKIPESLIIIGGGAIGCEMAQAFSRLGTKCTIVQMDSYLIPTGNEEAGRILEGVFKNEGIDVYNSKKITKVEKENKKIALHTDDGLKITADKLMVAAGRKINLDALKLDNAGIKYNNQGVIINKHLRTNKSNIYAVGDCNGKYLLTHAAMHQGMIALMNTMLPVKMAFAKFVVPWTVFTEPQISCVGMNEKELKKRNIKYQVITSRYEDYGAAIAEEIGIGFVKIYVSSLGKIYGASIVGEGSGEMINELAMAVQKKVRMHEIMLLQHSFPTMGFLIKRASEEWMMKKMKSNFIKNMCRFMFRI